MGYSIGIDIGGTKISCVLVDSKCKIINRTYSLTEPEQSRKKIINNIIKAIQKTKATGIGGIGISCSGVTDNHGKFIFNPNIKKLEGVNLKSILQKRFKCKVNHENDANCFALAESVLGAAKGKTNIVGIIIGTGIGAGIIINKKIYSGSKNSAGEIGHSVIYPKGPICKCGLRGDFESLCSGPAIVKRYYEKGGKIMNADPAIVFYSKEKAAKKTVEELYKHMGIGISHVVNLLNPELIVLGGGVSNLPFYKQVNKEVKKYSNKAARRYVKVIKNSLGSDSGAIGASLLI